jgi:hypothetical protein
LREEAASLGQQARDAQLQQAQLSAINKPNIGLQPIGDGKSPTLTIAVNTINNNLTRIGTLFKWAIDQGFAEENPFDGLSVGKKKRSSEERQAFGCVASR